MSDENIQALISTIDEASDQRQRLAELLGKLQRCKNQVSRSGILEPHTITAMRLLLGPE